MEELLIEEKKYISSKRAARVTGYAKDYIGQLCREGRVSARLVGRSWYVLESAIHDHRFGYQKSSPEIETESVQSSISPTWESPRYEASPVEMLPLLISKEDAEGRIAHNHQSQLMQDSWKEWFERVTDVQPKITRTEPTSDVEPEAVVANDAKVVETEVKEEIKSTTAKEEKVIVPLHLRYRRPPEELLPEDRRKVISVPLRESDGNASKINTNFAVPMSILKIVSVLIAILTTLLAVIGSGYVDKIAISSNTASAITGITVYKK
jgi:hypothetical protein